MLGTDSGPEGHLGALLDAVRTHGVAAEPDLLAAVMQLSAEKGWAGKVDGAFRFGGNVLIVVNIAADMYYIYKAQDKSKATVEILGGWSGALAMGATAAELLAPANLAGPCGCLAYVAAMIGAGAFGFFCGSNAAKSGYELVVEGRPIAVGEAPVHTP